MANSQLTLDPSTDPLALEEDDLNIGGDIFGDFNEEIEDAQILEDERFYRYGRFFSFQLGFGLTSFDGNRGIIYENDPPSFNFGVNYFMDFNNSFGLGFEFSKHSFFVGTPTLSFPTPSGTGIGQVDVNMLRVYFSYRYYINTDNLGTALTFSNPYFTGRLEYWYTTNKFISQNGVGDDSGGGLGLGVGFGLEFPLKLREYYINLEFLVHSVNFHDKYTTAFSSPGGGEPGLTPDLSGNAFTSKVTYVISW